MSGKPIDEAVRALPARWRTHKRGLSALGCANELELALTAAQQQGQASVCEACNGRGEVGGLTPGGYESHPCPECEQQQGQAVDREADRARFSDAAFNAWLDTGISDAGHTVWDAVGDTRAAWAGWEARQFAGDAVLISECCGREECGGECGNEWRGMGMYRKPAAAMSQQPEARGEWPDYLMIRDTGLQDDMGGLGQRIFTTAGAGFRKIKYVRADLAAPRQSVTQDEIDEFNRAIQRTGPDNPMNACCFRATCLELMRDAERYRYLRKHHAREWVSDSDHDRGAPSFDIAFSAPGYDLDAAIDAAMQEAKP